MLVFCCRPQDRIRKLTRGARRDKGDLVHRQQANPLDTLFKNLHHKYLFFRLVKSTRATAYLMLITNQRKHINPNIFNVRLNKKSLTSSLTHCKHSNLSFVTLTASTNQELRTPPESLGDPGEN